MTLRAAITGMAVTVTAWAATVPGVAPPKPTDVPIPQPTLPAALTDPAITAPVFTQAPSGTVLLPGRVPGGKLKFASNGGLNPLKFSVLIQPAQYQSYFTIVDAATGLPFDALAPSTSGTDLQSALNPTAGSLASTRQMALKFAGLAMTQALPQNIDVFLHLTDGAGRQIEKYFGVKLTNSFGIPVIDSIEWQGISTGFPDPDGHLYLPQEDVHAVNALHANTETLYLIKHRNFRLSEPGSRLECRYPSGLRYHCYVSEHGATQSQILIYDLGEGTAVTVQLVNDSGVSTTGAVPFRDQLTISATETEELNSSGFAVGERVKTHPKFAKPFLGHKKSDCETVYLVWQSVSGAHNVRTNQIGDLALRSVVLKSRPDAGSVISNSNAPEWELNVAGATGVSFDVDYAATARVGRCSERVITAP